jgi:hypothetical protein
MESIADFGINLPWVVPVKPAEGLTVVELHAPVGYIQGVERRGEAFTKILAEGKIEGCVLWQVISWIGLSRKRVAKARAVVNVR